MSGRPTSRGSAPRGRGRAASRPRIAFLVWRDTAHPEGGGSELFIERVAEHLAGTGWDVTICAAAHANGPRDEVRRGVRIRRRGGRLSVYLHGLAYLLTRRGRDTDIVVDVQNGIPFFSPLVRRRGIVNLVHHVHNEQWHIIYPGLIGRMGWFLESRVAPRLYRHYRYVTVSAASSTDLVGLGVEPERISIVHNGIDAPHPVPQQPRADEPTVCTLGRLVPHKQVEHALEAAAVALEVAPNLRVDVVGDGWWHDTLTARAHELGIDEHVTFHGAVSDQDRDAALDRAWVLLAPSVKEGWGIAIMEAAAHGVPTVAYRSAGGVCESVVDGETGWLVDDLAGLVKRTEELLTDRALRDRLGANARARAASFDWASTGRRFAEVLLPNSAPAEAARRQAVRRVDRSDRRATRDTEPQVRLAAGGIDAEMVGAGLAASTQVVDAVGAPTTFPQRRGRTVIRCCSGTPDVDVDDLDAGVRTSSRLFGRACGGVRKENEVDRRSDPPRDGTDYFWL